MKEVSILDLAERIIRNPKYAVGSEPRILATAILTRDDPEYFLRPRDGEKLPATDSLAVPRRRLPSALEYSGE